LDDAIDFFCNHYGNNCKVKFDESLEVVFKLVIDPSKSEQTVRGSIVMPCGLGKKIKIMAIVEDSLVPVAMSERVDFCGGDEMIDKIQNGFCDFDVCVTTPIMMPKVSKVAKKLGPKGLMPNPKLGTVSNDIVCAIADSRKGRVNFRSDKSGLVHSTVGRLSFGIEKVRKNIIFLYTEILKSVSIKTRSNLVEGCYITSSQGPSLELDLKSFIV
jgi:large subunit ribosomal protein L1